MVLAFSVRLEVLADHGVWTSGAVLGFTGGSQLILIISNHQQYIWHFTDEEPILWMKNLIFSEITVSCSLSVSEQEVDFLNFMTTMTLCCFLPFPLGHGRDNCYLFNCRLFIVMEVSVSSSRGITGLSIIVPN